MYFTHTYIDPFKGPFNGHALRGGELKELMRGFVETGFDDRKQRVAVRLSGVCCLIMCGVSPLS